MGFFFLGGLSNEEPSSAISAVDPGLWRPTEDLSGGVNGMFLIPPARAPNSCTDAVNWTRKTTARCADHEYGRGERGPSRW